MWKPEPNHRLIQHLTLTGANGVRLHAAAVGERGPVMLFLHGFPECWQAWHRQLPEFSGSFQAVALDLRGYNLSEKPRGVSAYALKTLVEDIREVLKQLSPGAPAILVGHDWGGILGWLLARDHPELLRQLIIINAPHPRTFSQSLRHSPAQWFSSAYIGLFNLPGVAEWALRAFDFSLLKAMTFGASTKPENFSPLLRQAYEKAWSSPYALTAGLNYYRNPEAWREMITARYHKVITVPTLVLWGEKDPSLRKRNLVGLDRCVEHVTIRRHPTATHWIVHEEPEWVHEHIWSAVLADGVTSGRT